MRRSAGLVTGLLILLCSANASAAKLLAVLPLDVTNTDGKMSKASRASLEEMLRDVASNALGSAGWTVLTNENQLQILTDNNIDPASCGDQSCHLAAARELKADLFISGAVQWSEGEYTASIRLLDSKSGRIVASERLAGTSTKQLRTQFEERAAAFFAKVAGLIGDSGTPVTPPTSLVGPQVRKAAITQAVGKLTVAVKPKELAQLELTDPDGKTTTAAAAFESTMAKPGSWKVIARASGYQEEKRTFDVPADDVTLIKIELLPLGGLSIVGEPAGSAVRVTGPGDFKDEGGLPWEATGLPSGRYTVMVSRAGYRDDGRSIEVAAGKTATVNVTLHKEGEQVVSDDAFLAPLLNAGQTDQKPRARALLVTEIQGLESLFANTAKTAPDHAPLLRRLGEAYLELERSAHADWAEATPALTEEQVDRAKKVENAARTSAIKLFTALVSDHPDYVQLDEVEYRLGLALRRQSDKPSARNAAYDLIKKRPQSKYVPAAYFLFGEMFTDEAASDAEKWALAVQAYQETLKYPPPENKLYGAALYRLGAAQRGRQENVKALDSYKKAIDWAVKYPEAISASKLAEAARHELIPVLATTGDPQKAYYFLRPLSGDAPGESLRTYSILAELGQAYLDRRQYRDAITIYRDLIARDRRSEAAASYEAHLAAATEALKRKE